jgi:hypothetical protein
MKPRRLFHANNIRHCALCGRPQPATVYGLLVQMAKDAGIKLARPNSYYLGPHCADTIRKLLKGGYTALG